MKKRIKTVFVALAFLLLTPYMITVLINGESMRVNGDNASQYVSVKVGNHQKEILWEEYFVGLLAKEIDVTYADEALKAQAVLTRTNLYRQIEKNKTAKFENEYMTYNQMEKTWGKERAKNIYRRLKAVASKTGEQTIMYQGKLAAASFHQLSAGSTRNGVQVLGADSYAYLKEKPCPKDVEAELQLQTLVLSYEEVMEYCRGFLAAVEKENAGKVFTFDDFEIKEKDAAGYVTKIRIGNEIYSGEEFRSGLALPSSSFSLQDYEGKLRITTKGVGHGLGMSQYTANEMAKEGKTYEEILQYFFEGVEIKEVAEILLNIE